MEEVSGQLAANYTLYFDFGVYVDRRKLYAY
jgi:hypothetical protein